MKKIILFILLSLLLISAVSCGTQNGADTGDLVIDITPSAPTEDGEWITGVYVHGECFGGALKKSIGYEVSDDRFVTNDKKTLDFAGQSFELTRSEREVSRVFNGEYVFEEDGSLIKSGKVLRAYDSYEGGNGSLSLNAAWAVGAEAPSYVRVSGKDVLYVDGKTERELLDLANRWLVQTFNFNTSGLTCAMISYLPTEQLDGYIEGADRYLISFVEKTGEIETRSAYVTFSQDDCILLVHNYPLKPYEEFLRSLTTEDLTGLIEETLKSKLKKYKELSVKLIATPYFDVCGQYAYIEFTADASYVLDKARQTETIVGLLTLKNIR